MPHYLENHQRSLKMKGFIAYLKRKETQNELMDFSILRIQKDCKEGYCVIHKMLKELQEEGILSERPFKFNKKTLNF